MSTRELERAVQELPAEEFASFAAWIEEYLADRWDEEIRKRSSGAGALGRNHAVGNVARASARSLTEAEDR